jgi:hypothetical protein
MCDKDCRKLQTEYQELLLKQIQILSNEVKAWRMISSESQKWSIEEFIRSTDSCGWEHTLKKGILQFPNFSKRFWSKLLDLFKI